MRLLALVTFIIEVALWIGLAILGLSWSWIGALLAFGGVIVLWATFMSPKGRWRLPPWPRAIIGLGLCLVVGVRLLDTGWPRYGLSLILGGIVLGLGELVLKDIRSVPRDVTSTRHPYNL
jgi:hypothetical protein